MINWNAEEVAWKAKEWADEHMGTDPGTTLTQLRHLSAAARQRSPEAVWFWVEYQRARAIRDDQTSQGSFWEDLHRLISNINDPQQLACLLDHLAWRAEVLAAREEAKP